MTTTTDALAADLDRLAETVDQQSFPAMRRALRQRLAREGVDHSLIWVGNIPDFQAGCRELAGQMRTFVA